MGQLQDEQQQVQMQNELSSIRPEDLESMSLEQLCGSNLLDGMDKDFDMYLALPAGSIYNTGNPVGTADNTPKYEQTLFTNLDDTSLYQ